MPKTGETEQSRKARASRKASWHQYAGGVSRELGSEAGERNNRIAATVQVGQKEANRLFKKK